MIKETDHDSGQPEPARKGEPDEAGDLLYLTRAYNRQEISLEEWLRRSKQWAERIIKESGKEQNGRD